MNIKDVCVGIDVNVEIGKSYITLWFYSSDIGQSSNGNAWLNRFFQPLKIISQSLHIKIISPSQSKLFRWTLQICYHQWIWAEFIFWYFSSFHMPHYHWTNYGP